MYYSSSKNMSLCFQLSPPLPELEACSAKRMLVSDRQNFIYPQCKFWRALASSCSAKHTSDVYNTWLYERYIMCNKLSTSRCVVYLDITIDRRVCMFPVVPPQHSPPEPDVRHLPGQGHRGQSSDRRLRSVVVFVNSKKHTNLKETQWSTN